ncbi:hypothetical protein ES703_84152 [subsurface metagenome]
MGLGLNIESKEVPVPTYTKKIIICPQCHSTLELTVSSDPEENIPQVCPSCGTAIEEGTEIRLITIWGKTIDWLKKYWMWVGTGGLGVGLIIALTKKRRK